LLAATISTASIKPAQASSDIAHKVVSDESKEKQHGKACAARQRPRMDATPVSVVCEPRKSNRASKGKYGAEDED
jgi:hypothetical protein